MAHVLSGFWLGLGLIGSATIWLWLLPLPPMPKWQAPQGGMNSTIRW
ncbi:hypothetical protein [Mycobacteroides chelonae]|nr:hypothetical protein [Mycobacteroides chelonae]